LQKPKDNPTPISESTPDTATNPVSVVTAPKPKRPAHNRSNGQSNRQNNNQRRPQQQQQPKNIAKLTEADLENMSGGELSYIAKQLGFIGGAFQTKERLIKIVLELQEKPITDVVVQGVLEKLPDNFGFLRFKEYDYVSGPDDVYVSPSLIRRYNLNTGDTIKGSIRNPNEGEKYFALQTIEAINMREPKAASNRLPFERLTPLHPDDRINLETRPDFIASRIMNMFTPIGKGQRGLIVAPPKVGKTVLLKELAQSMQEDKSLHIIILLIDERPEEVEDMRRSVKGENTEVISSTFDESHERHVQVAETVLSKAKRMVENGQNVVILLDSITRLARAYNTISPASGKVLTGGIDANALQRPKRFFGAARKTEEQGSLTIIATALIDTGSRMDEVIYEEFKGTGNMELHLTRKLSNRRVYPAFDLVSSSTRRDDLLLSEDERSKVWIMHKFLSTMNIVEGVEFIINQMKKCKTNEEFFESMQSNLPENKAQK
jgi:transcription termination factor Rho